jgi:hypothetical protein
VSGRLVLMGSGELAPSMVSTHRRALRESGAERVVLLDTPFGFQENADELTARIVEYFRTSLQVEVEVASLRRADLPEVEVRRALSVIDRSSHLFSGPGSPSYALRVWHATGAGGVLAKSLASGATVVLASAAALTAGTHTIPVYEIYKVGEDPFWRPGLDLTSRLGLPLTVVPHWNNAEGGTHDTSRCFIGRRRFDELARSLDTGVLGVDEHTAATLDFTAGTLTASGAGEVTLLGRETLVLEAGGRIPLDEARRLLGAPPAVPAVEPTGPAGRIVPPEFRGSLAAGDVTGAAAAMLAAERAAAAGEDREALRIMIVELAEAARRGVADPAEAVAGFVDLLLDLRASARSEGRFDLSDLIRDRLGDLGVEVRDTRGGVEWELHPGGGDGAFQKPVG